MQKWYEGGYFTPDLLMKRTHIDNEWIPVGELARRAGGGKLFLSLPFTSAAPPGLSRSNEPPVKGFTSPHDLNVYNTPYQPVPTRSLRTSTLDSYLSSTSNPSDSPSSSFGAGRFSNGSPDPAAFGGRMSGNLYNTDHTISGRVSSFGAPGPSFTANRVTFNESSLDPSLVVRGGGFGNTVSGRASSVDNYGFNGVYNTNQTPWTSNSINSTGPDFDGGLAIEPMAVITSGFEATRPGFNPGSYLNHPGGFNDRGPQDAQFGEGNGRSALNDFNVTDAQLNPPQVGRPRGDDNLAQHSGFSSHTNGPENTAFSGQNQQPYSQSPSLQYAGASQHPAISLQTNVLPTHDQPTSAPQSPWAAVELPPTRRLGPFDAGHPKATNTVIKRSVTPPQPSSPWGPTNATSPHPSQTNGSSPWYAASQGGAADESWREAPGPNSLTFDNVGAHNQQHENPANDAPAPAAAPVDLQLPLPTEIPSQYVAEHVPSAAVLAPTVPKPKRKSATQQNQTATPALKTQPALSQIIKDPSPPPTQNKPAWAIEEDTKKVKPSGAGLGLREIQEAEAKKLEARKAAERERAARAATSASPAGEDTPSFTASWGLPTSRAGARTDISPKEGPTTSSSSPPAPNTPVWTNTGKPQQTKKTMKEIQEEEERRKKMAIKETTAAVTAARRGYVDTTNKVSAFARTSTTQISHFRRRAPHLSKQVVHGPL